MLHLSSRLVPRAIFVQETCHYGKSLGRKDGVGEETLYTCVVQSGTMFPEDVSQHG